MTNFNNPISGESEVAPNPFTGGGDQASMPAFHGFEVSATRKSPINAHGLLVFAMVIGAGAAIYGMRSIGLRGVSAATTEDMLKLGDLAGSSRSAVMTVEDQRLLADLNASRTSNQVPKEELFKNPFALAEAAKPRPRSNPGQPAAAKADASPEELAKVRQDALLTELGSFKLQGVMGGSKPVARINGKAYRVGDVLQEKGGTPFEVMAVDGREVTVKAEGFVFVLSMDAN